VTRLMKRSVLSALQQAISIINRQVVRMTPSSRTDLTIMGVMALGSSVNILLKFECTPSSGKCDKVIGIKKVCHKSVFDIFKLLQKQLLLDFVLNWP